MAKKSLGGIDEQVKAAFDSVQEQIGAGSANETLAALLEGYDASAMLSAFDEVEVAGISEVKRLLTGVARQMVMVLSHRHDLQDEAVAEQLAKTEALEQQLQEANAALTERDEILAAQSKELDELRTKAASVDALTEAMKASEQAAVERERAQAERFDKAMSLIQKQVERYEADVEKLTVERDEAKQQAEALASEVEQLQVELNRVSES